METLMSPRDLLLGSFHAAFAAADPLKIVPQHLPKPPKGRTLVVGAGKAAAAMALAVEQNWPAGKPLDGLVITRYRHGLLTSRITVIEAGHPVPDESGEKAAQEILRRAKSLTPDDLLLVLVSGGGSALLSLPRRGHQHGRSQGHDARAVEVRRADPGHEHGEEAPLRDPGRPARRRVPRAGRWRW